MSSVSRRVDALILQEEISRDVPTDVGEFMARATGKEFEQPLPRTVAIRAENYHWVKYYPVETLLGRGEDITKFFLVPEDIVRKWGLKTGDRISYDPKQGFWGIFAVNGFTDPEDFKQRPKLISDVPATYAERRLPVEKIRLEEPKREGEPDGNTSIRAFTLLAPLPEGGVIIIAAPALAGKSTQFRFLYEALLKLIEYDKDLFVIALQVGERPQDAEEMRGIWDKVEHDRSRSELYLSPAGDPKEEPRSGHFWLARLLKARAERLTEGTGSRTGGFGYGYKVVLLIDSLSRVKMSHSFSERIEKPDISGGLLSQGLHVASLTATLDILQVAGSFGKRSLTIVTTMLKDEVNPKKRKRAAEHVLFDQAGPSSSVTIWGLVNSQDEKLRPSIDLDLTYTREFHRICTCGQFSERAHVLKIMWESPYTKDEGFRFGTENALRNYLGYVKDNPTYESSQFAVCDK